MNQHVFEAGYDLETYLRTIRSYRSVVRGLNDVAAANSDHVSRLKAATSALPGPVRATVLTEDWCGDSACNVPILGAFFGAAGIDLRIIRGSEVQELNKKYNDEGDDHIPVISVWDGNWNELARWIEAPKAVGEKKDAWKAERPEFMELYGRVKEDPEAAKKFQVLYRGFLEEMADWYKAGMWEETTREIVELIES